MAGAGLDPRRGLLPPFWKADIEGLDAVLEQMEGLQERHGDRFAPPVLLRRLVAQGRLGLKSGQGFYPYPQPDEGEQAETVKLETRGDVAIAWLANAPMNAVSPDVIRDLKTVWERVKASDEVGAMVIVSSVPVVFSAGADIKAFTRMDEGGGEELIHTAHALLRDFGQARVSTVAAVNAIAFGGGCELAMACDVRIAAEAAVFGQPEVKLGIIPGFGGTQRLPRLVGPNKALEMNLIGDAILAGEALESGLVNRVVPDHELFETALMWGRKLAAQAPVAVEQIKTRLARRRPRQGIEAEKQGFATAFRSEDAKEGISALPRQAHPQVERQVADRLGRRDSKSHISRLSVPSAEMVRLAEMVRESHSTVALTGAGVSVPSGIPDFRTPGDRALGQRRPDGGRSHRRLRARPGAILGLLPASLPVAQRQAAQPCARGAGRAGAARPARGRDHAEHRPAARHRRLAQRGRGARLDRDLVLSPAALPPMASTRSTRSSTPTVSRSAAAAAARSSPTSSSSASCCPRARWRRRRRWRKGPSC